MPKAIDDPFESRRDRRIEKRRRARGHAKQIRGLRVPYDKRAFCGGGADEIMNRPARVRKIKVGIDELGGRIQNQIRHHARKRYHRRHKPHKQLYRVVVQNPKPRGDKGGFLYDSKRQIPIIVVRFHHLPRLHHKPEREQRDCKRVQKRDKPDIDRARDVGKRPNKIISDSRLHRDEIFFKLSFGVEILAYGVAENMRVPFKPRSRRLVLRRCKRKGVAADLRERGIERKENREKYQKFFHFFAGAFPPPVNFFATCAGSFHTDVPIVLRLSPNLKYASSLSVPIIF